MSRLIWTMAIGSALAATAMVALAPDVLALVLRAAASGALAAAEWADTLTLEASWSLALGASLTGALLFGLVWSLIFGGRAAEQGVRWLRRVDWRAATPYVIVYATLAVAIVGAALVQNLLR